MTDPRQEPDDETVAETADENEAAGETDDAVAEQEYAQGQTADPDGAERDVPAGEDYAGSGF
jgi:hypothetical protein